MTSSKPEEPFDIRCARNCMCCECAQLVDNNYNCSLFKSKFLIERLRQRAEMNRRNKNEERALAYEVAIRDAEELLG